MMSMSMSLDGFVSGSNGKAEWIFKNSDEESRAWALTRFSDAGLIIMGRKTFEVISAYWPTASGPFATTMNEVPKAVFTEKGFTNSLSHTKQTPAVASWAEAQVFDGDLAEEITRLKSEPGKPIVALGGAGFMRSLIATGLIDEYNLIAHPVVLGEGQTIFHGAPPMDLKLADVKAFPHGIVARTYRV